MIFVGLQPVFWCPWEKASETKAVNDNFSYLFVCLFANNDDGIFKSVILFKLNDMQIHWRR